MSYTRKLRIGSDGTIGYGINTASGYVFDMTPHMRLSDTNLGDFARLSSLDNGFPLTEKMVDTCVVYFNQNTRLTKFNVFHSHTTTMQLSFTYSTDTTDGIDGTWTNVINFPVAQFTIAAWQSNTAYSAGDTYTHTGTTYTVNTNYTSGATWGTTDTNNNTAVTVLPYTPPIAPDDLITLDFNDVASCNGIRVKFYGSEKPYGKIRLFNVFGEHLAPKFRFYDSSNVELTGDSPLSFSNSFSKFVQNTEIVKFKVGNSDSVTHTYNIDVQSIGTTGVSIADFITLADEDSMSVVTSSTMTITNGDNLVTLTGRTFSATDVGSIIKASSNNQLFIVTEFIDGTHVKVHTNATSAINASAFSIVVPNLSITTAQVPANGKSNLLLVLFCPANSELQIGQSQFSIDVMEG